MKYIKKMIVTMLIFTLCANSVFAKVPKSLSEHPLGNSIYKLVSSELLKTNLKKLNPDTSFTRNEAAQIINKIANGFIKKSKNNKWGSNLKYNDTKICKNKYYLNEPKNLLNKQAYFDKSIYSYLKDEHSVADSLNMKRITSYKNANTKTNDKAISRKYLTEVLYNLIMWTYDKEPIDFNKKCKIKVRPNEFIADYPNVPLYEKAEFLRKKGVITYSFIRDIKRDTVVSKAEFSMLINKIVDIEGRSITSKLPSYKLMKTKYISQLYPLRAVVGCEGTALLMALQAKGYAKNVNLRTFLDNMPKHKSNPEKGFVGSPYKADLSKKTRTTIFPPVLTKYAKKYGNVVNVSGYDANAIKKLVLAGKPVIAYMTMNYEKPYYRTYNIEGKKIRYLSNNHIVMIAGYDKKTNRYFIKDPYNKKNVKKPYEYWIKASKFDPIYNERKHAVAVY